MRMTRYHGYAMLAALAAFSIAAFGVWRLAVMPDPLSWELVRACIGSVLAFGLCRFFLARTGLMASFTFPLPLDPERLRLPDAVVLPAVGLAGAVSLALVSL